VLGVGGVGLEADGAELLCGKGGGRRERGALELIEHMIHVQESSACHTHIRLTSGRCCQFVPNAFSKTGRTSASG